MDLINKPEQEQDPDRDDPKGKEKMAYRCRTIDDDGILIDMLYDYPDRGSGRCPLLIILHGLTGYKEEAHLAELARMAKEAGFASLRADLYGHGAGGGSFHDHTLRKWTDQIRKLIRDAAGDERFSGLFLCGHSQGGLCALLAASCQEETDGVIALAPALKIPEQARKGALFGHVFDPGNVPDEVTVWDKPLSGNYIREAQSVRDEEITAYKGPVLFVHSDTDERVPAEVSRNAVKKFRNAQLVMMHGDTHDFDLHPEVMADAVCQWLSSISC